MKNTSCIVSGQAFVGEDLELRQVDVVITNGIITAVEEKPKAPMVWICPAFFNAHTHLGDTIAMDCGRRGDLASLVTPPEGLKHRLLAAASPQDRVSGMRASIQGMLAGGTAGCADFREGGVQGVAELREASERLSFRPVIFGRDGGEAVAEGLGISSTRDIPDADTLAANAHRLCADRQIPIVVCPRSNWTLGVTTSERHPPLKLMQDLGCKILLGTDNVMFIAPDMFSEMDFTSTVYGIESRVLLHAAVRGSDLTGPSFFIRKGVPANLFMIDPVRSSLHFSRDPVTSIIKRASFCQISHNVFNL